MIILCVSKTYFFGSSNYELYYMLILFDWQCGLVTGDFQLVFDNFRG